MSFRRVNKKGELDFMHEVENSIRFLAILESILHYEAPFNVAARFSCLESLTIPDCGSRHVLEQNLAYRGKWEASEKGMTYSCPKIEYLEPAVFASRFL